MLSVVDLAEKIGDYQRPYLTLFKIEFHPDLSGDNNIADISRQIEIEQKTIEAADNLAISYGNEVRVWTEIIANYDRSLASIESSSLASGLDARHVTFTGQKGLAEATKKEYEGRRSDQIAVRDAARAKLQALREQLWQSDILYNHYRYYYNIIDTLDIYSVKTVFPAVKTVMQSFWWEGAQYFYPGRDDSDKQGEFTFILDQDMLLLPFLYTAKDLTGTDNGQFRAARGNIYEGDYRQEFDFGVYQLSTDRVFTTNYCRLKGVRVFEVSGVTVDKSHTGENIPLVSVKCGWDHTEWDDSRIGIPILSVEDLKVEE